MIFEDTVDLMGNILFIKDLAETVHIFGISVHLHQGKAEFITDIQNLKQQMASVITWTRSTYSVIPPQSSRPV